MVIWQFNQLKQLDSESAKFSKPKHWLNKMTSNQKTKSLKSSSASPFMTVWLFICIIVMKTLIPYFP